MEQLVTSDYRLGIIAGGQLGKMLALAASHWDIRTHILDQTSACPAATACTHLEPGDGASFEDVYRFGQQVDLLTFEIENVNTEALMALKAEGKAIRPDPLALSIIQDKGRQKAFFLDQDIPTAPFTLVESPAEVRDRLARDLLEMPFVQKARRSGYDGKGVHVVRSEADLPHLLSAPSVIETAVEIETEIAVIVARNGKGEMATFPPVEMVFSSEANLVQSLVSPARIDPDMERQAKELALHLADSFDIQGVLAVEFFVDPQGRLWVNEVSPRPHNSGHHTIESAITSQYEQHLRAILDFPLGCTDLKRPSVMINLLGEVGHAGTVRYEGLTEIMRIPGVKLHIYGKHQTRPFRKMGHVTVVASTREEALRGAAAVQQTVKVLSC